MVILSKALRLQATLRQLRYDRDVYLSNPPELDLLTAIPLPIMMSGIASRATALDAGRIGTAPRAFGELPDPASIPLRLEHKEDSNPGVITELSYDSWAISSSPVASLINMQRCGRHFQSRHLLMTTR
jgi:hypothetical protein